MITFLSEPNESIQMALHHYFPDCPLLYSYIDFILKNSTGFYASPKQSRKILLSETEEELLSSISTVHDKHICDSIKVFWDYNHEVLSQYQSVHPIFNVFLQSKEFLNELMCYNGLQAHIYFYTIYNYIMRTHLSIQDSLTASMDYIPYYYTLLKLSESLSSHYRIVYDSKTHEAFLRDSVETCIVNYDQQCCSCKYYQFTRVPCVHAILAFPGMYELLKKSGVEQAESFKDHYYQYVKYGPFYQQYQNFHGKYEI